MPNETAIANSGLDLHVKTEAGWHWLAVGQQTAQTNEVTLVENLLPGKREYLLSPPKLTPAPDCSGTGRVKGPARGWLLTQ
jgi:hypothetical protein